MKIIYFTGKLVSDLVLSVGTFNSFWGIRFRKDVADVINQIAK